MTASIAMVPLEIPLTHIASVAVDPKVIVRWDQIEEGPVSVGEHLGTPGPPGPPTAGKVSMEVFDKQWSWGVGMYLEGGRLERRFVAAHDPRKAIVIRLTNERYTKLVLAVTDPAATAARIAEAVGK